MRSFLAGLLSVGVTFALGAAALAQVKGEVVSIGLGPEGLYRPNCWTPMVVRLTATSSAAFVGKLVVKQADLDGDHVSYERPITLGGNTENSTQSAPFWMYFLPSPTLGKTNSYSLNAQPGQLSELDKAIQVFICDADGKQLRQLHITQGIRNIDWPSSNPRRGTKLVLCVSGSDRPPVFDETTLGMHENVAAVGVPISSISTSLPENVLGYEAVDAVLWMDAAPSRLSEKQASALREFVRRGGQLVILHGNDVSVWADVVARFGDLMPVNIKNMAEIHNVETLRSIHQDFIEHFYAWDRFRQQGHLGNDLKAWDSLEQPQNGVSNAFPVALAEPKPGAVVDYWLHDSSGVASGPFIARSRFGLGSVTWVAQDIADGNYVRGFDKSLKWQPVWDRVFDWTSVPFTYNKDTNKYDEADAHPYGGDGGYGTSWLEMDAGWIKRMDLENTGAALVGLAVLFFIIYWVIAGPGAYLFLGAKKKAGLNWFAFALAALVATGVTVLIVKAVLRGSARARHLSFVRVAPGEPALVRTQFGLYVPKDGYRTISIKDPGKDQGQPARPESSWYVTPFAIHSSYYDPSSTFTAPLDYSIPVMDAKTVEIPYRSTLKRLQAEWTGPVNGIDGSARLPAPEEVDKEGFISGQLANHTGFTLHHVYFIYNRPGIVGNNFRPNSDEKLLSGEDTILYTPDWANGASVALAQADKGAQTQKILSSGNLPTASGKWGKAGLRRIDENGHGAGTTGWVSVWFAGEMRKGGYGGAEEYEEKQGYVPKAFPMMSLFDRLPVMRADPNNGNNDARGRAELGRPGERFLDVSQAVSAGNLVVLAEAYDTPLPVPIEVDGNPITVEPNSTTYYQFILPLDRSAFADFGKPAPATQPATQSAMPPATRATTNPTAPRTAPPARRAAPARGPEVER